MHHTETTTLHSIHLKLFPFQKSKQKYYTIKVFDLLNQVTWRFHGLNIQQCWKVSICYYLIFNLATYSWAYNKDNKSWERFALSTIYGAANFRIQYLCGLYTAVEVVRLAKGYLIWFLKFQHIQLHLGFKNIQEQLTWQEMCTTNSVLILVHLAMLFYHPSLFDQSFSTSLSFFSQWHCSQKVLGEMIGKPLLFLFVEPTTQQDCGML